MSDCFMKILNFSQFILIFCPLRLKTLYSVLMQKFLNELSVKSIKLIPLNPFIRPTPIQLIRPMQELNAQSIVSLPFQ